MQIGQQKYPFQEFKITDMDEAGTTKYYGFVDSYGNWEIMQNNTTTGAYRYASGSSAYTTAWTGRAGLTFYYYYEL